MDETAVAGRVLVSATQAYSDGYRDGSEAGRRKWRRIAILAGLLHLGWIVMVLVSVLGRST